MGRMPRDILFYRRTGLPGDLPVSKSSQTERRVFSRRWPRSQEIPVSRVILVPWRKNPNGRAPKSPSPVYAAESLLDPPVGDKPKKCNEHV